MNDPLAHFIAHLDSTDILAIIGICMVLAFFCFAKALGRL